MSHAALQKRPTLFLALQLTVSILTGSVRMSRSMTHQLAKALTATQ